MLEGIRKKDSDLTTWQSFRLESDLIDLVNEIALKNHTSKSEIYRYAVKELLKKLKASNTNEESEQNQR